MSDVHIAGTGIWFPEDIITNDEIVSSFNSYVDNFNNHNKNDIEQGNIEAMEYSSSAFIEKASGIKQTYDNIGKIIILTYHIIYMTPVVLVTPTR